MPNTNKVKGILEKYFFEAHYGSIEESVDNQEDIDQAEKDIRALVPTKEEIIKLIKEYSYSTELKDSLGDRFITLGGLEELAQAIHDQWVGKL